ncbi:MAG: CHAT domain-containing protein [Sphingomonadaceae bacterium]
MNLTPVEARFNEALARYVAGPNADTSEQMIEVARTLFSLSQPGASFPEPRGYYDAQGQAITAAEDASASGDHAGAVLGYQLAIALRFGDTFYNSPKALEGRDIYYVYPLIKALVASRRYDAALDVIRAMLNAPDDDVGSSLFTSLGNDMDRINREDDLDAIEAYARMGLAAVSISERKYAKRRDIYDDALRWLDNRRAYAEVPDMLAPPSVDRMTEDQRLQADGLFRSAVMRLVANDQAAGVADMLAAAKIYSEAWDALNGIPTTTIGQNKIGGHLYGFLQKPDSLSPIQLDVIHRLKIAVYIVEDNAERAGAADDSQQAFDDDKGAMLAAYAGFLVTIQSYETLIDFAELISASPNHGPRRNLASAMAMAIPDLKSPDRLDIAERFARAGMALWGVKPGDDSGGAWQFAGLLDDVLAQRPQINYAALLKGVTPAMVPDDEKARADALFLNAVTLSLAGDANAAADLFGQVARRYLQAWPGDIAIPELRERQIDLIKALSDDVDRAWDARDLARAELGLRTSLAIDEGDARSAEWLDISGIAISRIAMLAFEQGAFDEARQLFGALINARNAEFAAEPAINFAGKIYSLNQAGRLTEAEAAGRFAVDLYRDRKAAGSADFAVLARHHGETLTRRNHPDEAATWLEIGWKQRDRTDRFESEAAAEALIGNLVRRGMLAEARPLIAAEADGDRILGSEAVKWLLNTAASPLRAFVAQDRLAMRQLALDIHEKSSGRDPAELVDVLNALGASQFELGFLAEAERLFRRSFALSEERFGIDTGYSEMTIDGLASVMLAQGRVDEAEALFRRYLAVASDYDAPDARSVRSALDNLLRVLVRQGKNSEADRLSQEALDRFGKPGAADPQALAGFQISRASVLLAQNCVVEAEALVRSAVALDRNRETLSWLVIVLEAQDKAAEAMPIIEAMLDEAEKDLFVGPYGEIRLALRASLARNLAEQGRMSEADAIFAETVDLLANVFGRESSQFADRAISYARHLLSSNRLDQAREVAEAVLQARVALRERTDASASDTVRLALARDEADAAALLVHILARGDARDAPSTLAAAFSALQRAETSAAGLALARSAASQVAASVGASDAVAIWRAAQARLTEIDTRISEAAASGPRGDAARRAASAERETATETLRKAKANLAARFPSFFDLINSQPLALSELQGEDGLLRNDEALIVLSPGHAGLEVEDQIGSVMVVTREGVAWADLPLTRSALTKAIGRFHSTLDASGGTIADDFDPPETVFSRAESFALYEALFGAPQIAALLADKAQWTLAPQGVFASLPFAALVTETPPGGADGDIDPAMLRRTAWLGLQKALAVTPSVSAIGIQRRQTRAPAISARLPFFGLGDPAFKGVADLPLDTLAATTEERGARRSIGVRGAGVTLRGANSYVRGGLTDIEAVNGLKRLTGTATEIRALAAQLHAGDDAIVLQLDASEAEIRRRNAAGALLQTDVIALATHGLLAGELSLSAVEPALALTPPLLSTPDAPFTSDNDGLLTASEAAQLSLSARFVILSACNTAASGKPDAESLSGLARAFFFAGAQALLVTHFYVYDSAAPLLTGKAIALSAQQGLNSAEAVRQSMVALAANVDQDQDGQSFAHPKAWAAFAVLDAN